MTYVWDTNILLQVLRSPDFYDMLNRQYDFTNPLNEVCISIVSVGEIHAIALRNRWGAARLGFLSATLQTLKTMFIDDDPLLIQMYSEMDVFSQKKHPVFQLSTTARKMGKNDLWIAATTAVTRGILLSTDADFTHLNGVFINFDKIIVT